MLCHNPFLSSHENDQGRKREREMRTLCSNPKKGVLTGAMLVEWSGEDRCESHNVRTQWPKLGDWFDEEVERKGGREC